MSDGNAGCPICGGPREDYETVLVLGRYHAPFFRCAHCGFIGATSPTWLAEAYSSAITKLDLGLLRRAAQVATIVEAVLRLEHLTAGTFLDWAGGYGTLTRMMRDRGFEFSHNDPFCENIFAANFEADPTEGFDLITAVEVLEHLRDPVAELRAVASATDRLLITTELVPAPAPRLTQWWYAASETGQHISFFTPDALRELARRLGYRAYVGRSFVHLFSRAPVSIRTRAVLARPTWSRAISITAMRPGPRSLLQRDYETVSERLRSEDR